MTENLTQNQIITIAGRKKMLRARAGEIQLPKIVGFVFGDGGVDADGNVIAPQEAESELKNELLRKKYDTYTMLSDTKCKYECELRRVSFRVLRLAKSDSMMRMGISLPSSVLPQKERMRISA